MNLEELRIRIIVVSTIESFGFDLVVCVGHSTLFLFTTSPEFIK